MAHPEKSMKRIVHSRSGQRRYLAVALLAGETHFSVQKFCFRKHKAADDNVEGYRRAKTMDAEAVRRSGKYTEIDLAAMLEQKLLKIGEMRHNSKRLWILFKREGDQSLALR